MTLLLKPTFNGDSNFDGLVTPDDYALLDRGFAKNLTGWVNGDFNYDGQVTSADYLLIDITYGQAQGFSPGFLAERQSQFGDAYVQQLLISVPEPSFLTLLPAATLPAFARRRRRH